MESSSSLQFRLLNVSIFTCCTPHASQIRIVFLCWLPWILRMSRPGRPLILEFPTTPCSDTSSERKHQILSDVELKERYLYAKPNKYSNYIYLYIIYYIYQRSVYMLNVISILKLLQVAAGQCARH